MGLMLCWCGNDEVDRLPFLDDDGVARIEVICHGSVHGGECVSSTYKDPNAPLQPKSSDAGGLPLVHRLGVYDKLVETVDAVAEELRRPAEYGVVEHHFAYRYPDTYRDLGERFGHVATHGSKHYTLSAYLGLMLGNLSRQDLVLWLPSRGTGRWDYNDDISAWSSVEVGVSEPILSWADFATASGFDPQDWPAEEFLPAVGGDEPEVGQ